MKTITVKAKADADHKTIVAELTTAAPRSEITQLFPYKPVLYVHYTVNVEDSEAKKCCERIQSCNTIESAFVAPERKAHI